MKRRTVLGSVGVCAGAFAGCASISAFSDSGYAITDFSVETEKIAPTHKYAIDHTRVNGASPETYGEYDDLDPAVAQILREAREAEQGLLRTNELPDGTEGAIEEYDLLYNFEESLGGATYDRYEFCEMDPEAPAALEFAATLRDDVVTRDDPAPVEFSITNTGDQKRYIVEGANPPLGLLTAEGPDGDRSFVLWTDYEGIAVTNDEISSNLGLTYTPVSPGETITDTYELRAGTGDEEPGKGLGPGEYTVSDNLSSTRQGSRDCPAEVVEWTVSFTVEER